MSVDTEIDLTASPTASDKAQQDADRPISVEFLRAVHENLAIPSAAQQQLLPSKDLSVLKLLRIISALNGPHR